jgi:branched-chain amino acid transport system substrate-binding protein
VFHSSGGVVEKNEPACLISNNEGEGTMRLRTSLKPLAWILACAAGALAVVPLSAAAEDLEVKVGFAAPLTGANAAYGKDLQNGVQLALDEANAKKIQIGGKTAKFTIQAEDDQADPRIGVQAAQKLVDGGVAVVVGHFNSGTTIPASQVYQTAGVPIIDPAATNPTITQRGMDHVFTVIASDAQNAGLAGTYAVKTTKAKRISILDDRTAFGQGEADEFEKAVKAAGGTIVAHQYSDNQTVDFSAQLTALKAENVDLIFFGGLDRQAAAVAKRMKQLGMTAQFVGGGGVMDSDFLKLAGDAGEGAMAWEYGSPFESLPHGKDFSARFQKAFGVPILSYAPFGYDAAWAAIHAMQKANSTDPKVYLPVLKKISFEGVTGRIAFDDKGALKAGSSTVYQVKNGAWVPLTTEH